MKQEGQRYMLVAAEWECQQWEQPSPVATLGAVAAGVGATGPLASRAGTVASHLQT